MEFNAQSCNVTYHLFIIHKIYQKENQSNAILFIFSTQVRLGTVQYLWQYGTGKLDTGPAVTFDLRAHGAMCFSEASAYGATAYF